MSVSFGVNIKNSPHQRQTIKAGKRVKMPALSEAERDRRALQAAEQDKQEILKLKEQEERNLRRSTRATDAQKLMDDALKEAGVNLLPPNQRPTAKPNRAGSVRANLKAEVQKTMGIGSPKVPRGLVPPQDESFPYMRMPACSQISLLPSPKPFKPLKV